MQRLLAIILAGGMGERLSILSQRRAKPAVPFAGRYRIIDFTLSNCVNSGIHNIIVLTQYQPVSLTQHIGIGTPWGLAAPDRKIQLLQPYLTRGKVRDWYKGTADAVYQNLERIAAEKPKEIMVLSGDHIYKMDFGPMQAFHRKSGADVTLAVTPMPQEELHRFGTVQTDANGQIVHFQEKVKDPASDLVSMGVYLFNTATLRRWLEEREGNDFGRDIFPRMVNRGRIFAYTFQGYWRDVGTVESYWQANMEILEMTPAYLADSQWPIYTREEEWPPIKVDHHAAVEDCLLSAGCIIDGKVERSVLSPGVCVAEGAVIKDSIIMENTQISANCVIDRAILDKEIIVGAGSHIGFGDDFRSNRLNSEVLSSGLSIIGKRAIIPADYTIGRNCIVYDGVTESDLPPYVLKSGETVKPGNKTVHAIV
jgi:glucose-1-phosphate adenylyltransferase